MDDFHKYSFSAPLTSGYMVSHDVYSKGNQSQVVVIIQELPGIGPETLELAEMLQRKGFRVVLPHLFGPLGRIATGTNLFRVFCMRKEFRLFAKNKSSPIVDWLKALCRDIKDQEGVSGVGVIGMCLTGNFAMSLIADDSVLAAVASQPSMPVHKQNSLHMSDQEIENAKVALDEKGPMLALRFEGDVLCQAEKFSEFDKRFNEDRKRIEFVELPGKGHSVLTLDFVKGGKPAEEAFDKVAHYFSVSL